MIASVNSHHVAFQQQLQGGQQFLLRHLHPHRAHPDFLHHAAQVRPVVNGRRQRGVEVDLGRDPVRQVARYQFEARTERQHGVVDEQSQPSLAVTYGRVGAHDRRPTLLVGRLGPHQLAGHHVQVLPLLENLQQLRRLVYGSPPLQQQGPLLIQSPVGPRHFEQMSLEICQKLVPRGLCVEAGQHNQGSVVFPAGTRSNGCR